ncbi:MAG: hypothetical protein EOP82_25645 [Variovorax sp.]|nr:MAG: hypothetical protein EOP82_25645 [Variovorax sp.]
MATKPVRGAVVEVVDGVSAAVLATATTDGSGAYSVSVPSNKSILVRVKAQMLQGGSGANWDVSVRDNTQADALYAMETPTFISGSEAFTRDIHAPSGWNGSSYGPLRVAAPFAVLDTIYTAQAKVLSVAPASVFPPLRVFWSANNRPASGNPAVGQIGTTFFTNTTTGRAIYVLGQENVDTDEYDPSVIAHEWGHYYQSAFSRDDSPGGAHSLNDLLDRRVAFSEGWGNAWSGIALGRSNYTDAVGQAQAQGSNFNLTAGVTSNPGWYREVSIQSILWNLNSQVGFKPIHDTLTGPFKSSVAVTSIHPFTAAFAAAAPGGLPVLTGLLAAQNISAAASDPFGTSETNDGGVAVALPMYRPATVGGSTSACVTNQAGSGNKLGSYAYLRFSVATAASHTITVTAPSAAADPDFMVYSGRLIAEAEGLGASEAVSVGLPAGESVLIISDFTKYPSPTTTCFTVSIQ